VEAVELVDRLLGVVGALEHDVCRALGLELGRGAHPHLPDRAVLAKEIVQVRAGDVEVAVVSYRRIGCQRSQVLDAGVSFE
jgi:hypothetical protein